MATCEHTFIAVKPDGVKHSLMGEIIRCFEQKVFHLIAMKLIQDLLKEHYIDLKDHPLFAGLVKYLQSGPTVAMLWEGSNVVKTGPVSFRETTPEVSKPGTIMGTFASKLGGTLSKTVTLWRVQRRRFAGLWFQPEELVDYKSCAQNWIYE